MSFSTCRPTGEEASILQLVAGLCRLLGAIVRSGMHAVGRAAANYRGETEESQAGIYAIPDLSVNLYEFINAIVRVTYLTDHGSKGMQLNVVEVTCVLPRSCCPMFHGAATHFNAPLVIKITFSAACHNCTHQRDAITDRLQSMKLIYEPGRILDFAGHLTLLVVPNPSISFERHT